jgi:cysteine-rich repeat protein
MRKCFAFALLLTLSWLGGLAREARAGVTIDVVFQDGPGHVLAIWPADWVSIGHLGGPGCTFSGYYGRVVEFGRCMDVVLRSTDDLISVSTSLNYQSDKGLALASMYEWQDIGVSFNKAGVVQSSCAPTGGLVDDGAVVRSFDCTIPEPNNPPVLTAGTYKIGTIVWDTADIVSPGDTQTIAAYIDGLVDGVSAVINGNIVDVTASVVLESAVLNVIVPICGNGVIEGLNEACDDGDTTPGDGCDASCQVEPGWSCAGEPSICSACGDGGIGGTEECDDGGTAPGDGCDASCQIETGWGCSHEPSVCRELLPVPSVSPAGTALLVVAIAIMGLVIAARRRLNGR